MSRILIIDDSEVMTDLLREFLVSHGYEIETAGSAEDGFQSVKRQKPDLLILDVQLPDINGLELCRHFRSLPETRSIPIIMISATAIQAQDKVQGLQQGADDYLTKPFDMPELLERIRAIMRRQAKTQVPVPQSSTPVSAEPFSAPKTSSPKKSIGWSDSLTQAVINTLLLPSAVPIELPPVTPFYLMALMVLLTGGLAAASGMAMKPLLVCLLALMTWGVLVSVLVISCSVFGIDLKWKPGAHLFSLAGLPLLLKLAGGTVLAGWSSLSPFYFSASPGLFLSSSSFLAARIDLFEIWTVVLLVYFVRRRPKAGLGKALAVGAFVWAGAIALLFCMQKMGGGA